MLPDFFANKYLVLFVSIAFLLYFLTPQVTFAGGKSTLLGWIIKAIAAILLVVAVVVTYGAATVPGITLWGALVTVLGATATGVGGVLTGLAAVTVLGLSYLSTAMTIAGVVGTGLCLTGTDNPFYTGCSGSAPSAYYIGNGTYNSAAAAPLITSSNFTSTCNSIKLCYSVRNSLAYALYRNNNLITKSETCMPADSSAYSFCYTDTGLTLGTSYDYRLVLFDVLSQSLLFPVSTVATKSVCP